VKLSSRRQINNSIGNRVVYNNSVLQFVLTRKNRKLDLLLNLISVRFSNANRKNISSAAGKRDVYCVQLFLEFVVEVKQILIYLLFNRFYILTLYYYCYYYVVQ